MGFSHGGSSFMRWIVFLVGLAILAWGAIAVGISAGVAPLSLVTIDTPIGKVMTDDRQFAGGLLLSVIGLLVIYVSSRL